LTRVHVRQPWRHLRRAWPWGLRLGLALLAGVAFNGALRWSVAAAIAFAPNAKPWAAQARVPLPAALAGLTVAAVRVPLGADAGELSSWVIEPSVGPAKGTIVLLHGVRMDKRSLAPMAAAFSQAGYRSVLVDLRGHGDSDGAYLTYGAADVVGVSKLLDVLRGEATTSTPIGVFGFSYGAATAIDLAAHDPRVAGVVAVASFSSLRHVIGDYRRKYLPTVLGLVPDAWFQRAVDDAGAMAGFDADLAAPLHNIANVQAKVLLIHGDRDSQVPLVHSQRLARASSGRAELLVIPGGTHDSMPVDGSHQIRDRAVSWFDACLAARQL
jgi:pimeloyl-ACP methyl ester carboxylesterase